MGRASYWQRRCGDRSVPRCAPSTCRRPYFAAPAASRPKEEIDAAWAEAVPEGLLLHVGAYVFVYGRMGVDK